MTQGTERDSSHRTLFEKLGVTSDAHVAICGIHEERFVVELNARLAKSASQTLRTKYDLIFATVDSARDLPLIARAARHLKPNAALWVFHPKGRRVSITDAEVRTAALAAGLVDNKIAAVNDTYTATRYVIPLARRA
jgi:hypothetical protein